MTDSFLFLGKQSIGTVPALVILAVAMFGLVYVLMALTPFGRQAKAVGSNVRAAYLAGIDGMTDPMMKDKKAMASKEMMMAKDSMKAKKMDDCKMHMDNAMKSMGKM